LNNRLTRRVSQLAAVLVRGRTADVLTMVAGVAPHRHGGASGAASFRSGGRNIGREKSVGRLVRWVALIAGVAAVTTCAAEAHPLQRVSLASAATTGMETAVAQSSAPLVVGVQDSWVSASCGSDPYRALFPGQVDTQHQYWVTVNVEGKKKREKVPYKDASVPAVDSPDWSSLGISTVRFSPTWDVALPLNMLPSNEDRTAVRIERRCLDYWMSRLTANGRHVTAEIAFKPDYCYKNQAGCPDPAKGRLTSTQRGQVIIPTLSEYENAMKAFIVRYGQVKVIAPWGEPDFQPGKPKPTKSHPHPRQGPPFRIGSASGANFGHAPCAANAAVDDCGPKLAAAMWITVRKLCPGCAVIAGDFGGYGPQDQKYLAPYNTYLQVRGYHPAVWGVHPYSDVKLQECLLSLLSASCQPERLGNCQAKTLVACFARWLKSDGYDQHTRIWLDELSSFYSSAPTRQWTRQVQAEGVTYLLSALPGVTRRGDPVVTRIYYLRFAGPNNDALIVGGTPQCAYAAAVSRPRLPTCAVTPASTLPGAQAPTAAAASAPGNPPSTAQYEIRNAADNLCLDANDKGPTAGRNGDTVQLWNCYGGTNQKWVPQYRSGRLAWLVSAKYPGMCLNANNVGGLANGRRVQIWNCYNTANELWNFDTLLANPIGAPLFLGSGGGSQHLALDADKYHLGNGDKVQVWDYYGRSTQVWYPDPA